MPWTKTDRKRVAEIQTPSPSSSLSLSLSSKLPFLSALQPIRRESRDKIPISASLSSVLSLCLCMINECLLKPKSRRKGNKYRRLNWVVFVSATTHFFCRHCHYTTTTTTTILLIRHTQISPKKGNVAEF